MIPLLPRGKKQMTGRIAGTMICRRRDEYGEIIVAEEGNRRTLYFGEGIIQSTIRIDRPDLLLEDYNEAMMSALIFHSEPRSILLIGLGGCSLVHFLLKAVPDCAVDVVEIRRQVIELARDFFLLPSGKANVRIFHAAGGDFIGHGAHSKRYDIVIVDAFDETAPPSLSWKRPFCPHAARIWPKTGCSSSIYGTAPNTTFPRCTIRSGTLSGTTR